MSQGLGRVTSNVLAFTDLFAYQQAVRAADVELLVKAKGDFYAELIKIDYSKLWMQRGGEFLPRVCHINVSKQRAPIFFLTEPNQSSISHSGVDLSPGELVFYGQDSRHTHSSNSPCAWGATSLSPESLAAISYTLTGRELTPPKLAQIVRPAPILMSRLLAYHKAAADLAKAAPEILAHPEINRALEQGMTHAMIMCLADHKPVRGGLRNHRQRLIMQRLEEYVASNYDRPLYLAEICTAIGVPERNLRLCCQEHLGMGPVRYLWLRRMHLARRALMLADRTATVSEIATSHGFWELGRFSVQYRRLFGETPSRTLRKSIDEQPQSARPLALRFSDSA